MPDHRLDCPCEDCRDGHPAAGIVFAVLATVAVILLAAAVWGML